MGPLPPVWSPPPSEKEAARPLPPMRFGPRGSTPPLEKEVAHHLPPTRPVPRGSTSSAGPPKWRRGPPGSLGRGVGCISSDLGVGVKYPVLGWRTRRKPHGSGWLLLAIPSVGKVEISPLGQAKSIAAQGAQQKRGSWAPLMGPHHQLESFVGASRHVTCRLQQPGAVLLNEFGELHYTFHRRPPPPASGLRRSSAVSVGWGGRFLACHSERHVAHGLSLIHI